MTLRASIVGASGYGGGELLRLLLAHPEIEIGQVTSERFGGKAVTQVHPNLRKRSEGLRFTPSADLEACDILFLGLPHGGSSKRIDEFRSMSTQIVDLAADFRLSSAEEYAQWYGEEHPAPEMLKEFVYGIPEIHRHEMREASLVSSAGCNATASILPLYPLFRKDLVEYDRTMVDVKAGSSEGGNKPSEASHHPERSGSVRSYKPTNHRHAAEAEQELSFDTKPTIHMSVTTIDNVRGVLATCHAFLKDPDTTDKDLWKVFRNQYGDEPFIRIVKERRGIYRYPEPKILSGTNYCDIGFEKDPRSNRVVLIAAIDNLMKGAAGQAVQAMNIMNGWEETTGLEFTGLHPI